MKNHYRIVKDCYLGFEVQIRRWWWPFWCQCHGHDSPVNTHHTIELARLFARRHALGQIKNQHVVEYL